MSDKVIQEDDVLLKINSKSDISEDDPNRREVLWRGRQQDLILAWGKKLRGKLNSIRKNRKNRKDNEAYIQWLTFLLLLSQ